MRANRMPSICVGSRLPKAGTAQRLATGLLIAVVLFLPTICLADNLLSGPQKIVIDAAHDRLLVSNYNTGALVQIDRAGNQSYFLQTAGFIDGMEIVGNTVYGAVSGKRVKAYDLDTALETLSVTISGTGYLSSLIADDSGYLYISCPLRNEIYKMRLSNGSYTTFVGGTALNRPNGMIFQQDQNRLVIIEDRLNPRIMAVSLADSAVTTLTATTLAGGDGIAEDILGNYYIAGYYLPGVYKFDSIFTHPPEMIYSGTGIVYPTYDVRDHSLLVTCYNTNTWVRIPLDPSGLRPTEDAQGRLLLQNDPNPFAVGTTIRFEWPTYGRVRLNVYGVSGNSVRALLDEVKGPRRYSVAWDGRNDSGQRVACGTYYVRLRATGTEQTRKAIVTR